MAHWFSVAAMYMNPSALIARPWGWTNRVHVFDAGAVSIDYGLATGSPWQLQKDLLDRPVDMCFTLFAKQEWPENSRTESNSATMCKKNGRYRIRTCDLTGVIRAL